MYLPDDIIAKRSVFMFNAEVMPKISDENSKVPIEITIHNLKEEAKDDDEESGVSVDES